MNTTTPTQDTQNTPLYSTGDSSEVHTVANESSASRGSPSSLVGRFAILTAFIVPMTFIPYLLTRGHVSSLRRQILELEKCNRVMRRELSLESSLHSEEHRRLRGLVQGIKEELGVLQDVSLEKDAKHVKEGEEVRSGLQSLLEEVRDSRSTQSATSKALGTSLADIAAFMQELELVMGLQGTVNGGHVHEERVDRLRQLAFRLSAQRTDARSSRVAHESD
ncbi:uncharacterized protein BT62DRAFT_656602 [Guyanagaster necrorhizus]|uniref:Uncharacterized protein n=1 Tax=Guyanagaster necrorhizus TaxID=856835 RepID=A0A9P8AUY9_9AGAR|nr:uncharacterized protein BT62DRAFT_656602 [Guyanagaster necrorhizus MCA 3950]KAG7448999.1 hypothetical protein BT62DRAFT_656602 [Guyanagaster necrorhizus MCA 3950]